MTGLGADIVEISRMEVSLGRTPDFSRFVFTDVERAFCEAQAVPERHYAACFAAKEGFLKAVGRGVLDGVPLQEIEVVQGDRRCPTLRLGPAAVAALTSVGGKETRLSLSSTAAISVALVIVS